MSNETVTATQACGCTTETDARSGVERSTRKCATHSRQRDASDEQYYKSLGSVDAVGRPANVARYVREIEDATSAPVVAVGSALEIGCGASPYVRWLQSLGYSYAGVEENKWAASWTSRTYGVVVWPESFPMKAMAADQYDLVLAAHVLEHVADAPVALLEMRRVMRAGATLIVLVPEGTDRANPDHLWFFYEDTLKSLVERSGFCVERLEVKRVVPKERFIYVTAKAV